MSQPWSPEPAPQPYGGQPYGPPPQMPPNPYMPQQPMYPPPSAPRPSQGLAIVALVLGVVAVVVALTPLRGVAIVAGIIAAILASVALIAKSQGGKKFAAGGLALGMASLPLTFGMYMWASESTKSNLEQQQLMQKCMEEEPENIIECANLD